MNILDLIILIVLALALWNGWRRGLIMQLFSLVAIVAAIWLAARYGGEAGAFLKLDDAYREPAGFVVVLLGGLLLVALLARLVRKVFQFAGFGLIDRLGGVLVAAAKYLLLLSLAFAAFEHINVNHAFLSKEKIETSKGYAPVRNLSRQILPFVEWLGEEVNNLKKEM
ncbi:MAG: CvpA family protein [Rikenellaceae bacterium]|nr:CvpA family protein [Rikenellaceae bacterium]